MSKIVLITGAYGFIGRHTARWFAQQGWHVIGMGHGSWTRPEWQPWGLTEWHTCDITLDTLLTYAREPQAIIHCAGSGTVGFSMTHPVQDFQRTVGTTLSVLEFVRLYANETKVVYPSSAGVYGVVQSLPISEIHPLSPVSPYGVHKKIAEELCQSYGQHFKVAAIVLRFFSIYGSGLRKQLLWDACTKLQNNDTVFSGTGEEIRDWLHISDVVTLIEKSLEEATPECPILNSGSGTGVQVQEVIAQIFESFGSTNSPIFSGSLRSGDPSQYVADITKALALGWQPKKSWRDGIQEYVEWYKRGAL
ncbi:MAG: hypothetical protein BWK78_07510 [Thiotrichaceae bacterium IS1]|nr:MAG: hypothetical protein BWK78_07510 [Thiotrichaceae bacterium IS1]